ncbi:CBS domain containing membrane protein [Nakamurella multipartita DSM 44233]|uniref:CBS domain containing membrane protein n=2 Tax=Nakamurella TaxID=53460 RepID=C8XFL3_NAKMY|nr:CBS domain containing membrane protein [Nakamurella multipartita DSM 44233]
MAAHHFVVRWLGSWRPQSLPYRRSEMIRGTLGSLLGLLTGGLAGWLLDVGPTGLPALVAPMGASAVLLFAAPASPLAQPWPMLGGNIISTVIGVATARLIGNGTPVGSITAAAVAVAAAIAVMMMLRCLHPPGGACALFAAVGTGAVQEQGFLFAVFPIAVNSLTLLIIAAAVNNLTGRTYPHVPAPVPDPAGTGQRLSIQPSEITAAIRRMDQGLDVLPQDIVALVRDVEDHAMDRRLGRLRVESVMTREVKTVQPTENMYRVRMIMSNDLVKAVPVVDEDRHVVGITTIYDLFRLDLVNLDPVSKYMTSPVRTIRGSAPVAELVALMSGEGLRHIPVVDEVGRLQGIVSRTELIAVLHRALVDATTGPVEPEENT